MITDGSELYGRLLKHALVPPGAKQVSRPRVHILKSLLTKVGPLDETKPPRTPTGRFAVKSDPDMMSRIAARRMKDVRGYFGLGTGRRSDLDRDVATVLQALNVSESEAEAFLASSNGQALAHSIRHISKPGQNRDEIAQHVLHHLREYRESQESKEEKNNPSLESRDLRKGLRSLRLHGAVIGGRE